LRNPIVERQREYRELAFQVKLYTYTQRNRVAVERHLETLKERGVDDPFLESVKDRLFPIEDDLGERITQIVHTHPVWTEWAWAVKGCGALTLGKIMGRCYRFYPGIDNLPEDKRKSCNARVNGARCGKEDLHFHGIEQYDTASQMRAHAGLAPEQRLREGVTITWDPILKSACWLMAQNLRRVVEYEKDDNGEAIIVNGKKVIKSEGRARLFYLSQKQQVRARWEAIYGTIGRKVKKDQLGDLDIDRRAMHKMIQVFLVLLWVVWRRSEGFTVRPSFAAEKLGHHDLQPEAWME